MKWGAIEGSKGNYNYDTPLRAVKSMESKGIIMRGHNIFWGGDFVPNWQKSMSGSQLRPELEKHIQGMVGHFKGKFRHWDVNNENLHLHFYEDKLHDQYITQWMFRETKKLDPSAKCYLNDYNIIASSGSTMAYVDQAYWFKASGVPLGGMGIQSHFGAYVDVSSVKRRLDEIATVGLPIWITELDISEPDEHKKAQKYEDLMRLYFSHPAVKGVMFWGFWDGRHWRPQAALANGNNVTPNAAGRKVQELLKRTWRTNESHNIGHGQTVHIRAFKGSYKLLVRHNGHVIHTQNFSLGGNGNNLKINLSGSGSNPHVDHVLIG
ncbi:anti-sigma-I factor RsgI6-like [Patella vulgata]|uniref:anti-sigma-I factor RsgI6-like n=1 Tax=Patella vulgata TaxID=6465 RepID=UPI0021807C06|nr:anti-sigma-I factor RsgI6-like [Patella vulgata]